jgi:diaminopimelate epimerase
VSRSVEFSKMHGAGNDFVVLDGRASDLPPLDDFCRAYAHRQFGIGFDQLLVVRDSDVADFRMEIWNAEGAEVEMCGNGIRAFLKYLRDRGVSSADELRVETLGGVVTPRWMGDDRVAVDMGRPILAPAKVPTTLGAGDEPVVDVPLPLDGAEVRVTCVSMGNPHAVVIVENVDTTPVADLGPLIENHVAFPNRTNVEFVEAAGRERFRQRTWERGVGETLACGSGACAVGVATQLLGMAEPAIAIELRGGELEISWDAPDASVMMTGPAAQVFEGRAPWPPDHRRGS